MNEFSFEHGNIGKGIVSAVVAGVKYLFVPLLLLIGISTVLLQAGGQEVAEQVRVQEIMDLVVMFGIPIVILSFFRGFYPRGTLSRFGFGVAAVAAVCLWIWFVTNGGTLTLEFEQFGATLTFTGLLLLFILAAALKGVLYLAELLSYRKEWLGSQESSSKTTADH